MQFRRWIVGMSVGIVLGAVTVAGAQTPRAEPEKAATVLRAGRMLDVRRGRLVENVVILVRGETIEAVGPAGQVRVPADARVIDLSRATVLPGLIDMHTHLTGEPRYIGYSALGLSVPRQALIGAKNARLTLMAGFTTVRNVGASGYTDVALRDAIEAGDLPGPRMVVSGPALGITGGHCDESLLPPEYRHRAEGVADGPAAVLQKVREVIKYGADVIKVCAPVGSYPRATTRRRMSSTRTNSGSSSRRPTSWVGRSPRTPTDWPASSWLYGSAWTPSSTGASSMTRPFAS